MEHQPFKVLFGMYLSGLCVGADTGVLYIRGEYPESVRTVENAINYLNDPRTYRQILNLKSLKDREAMFVVKKRRY